MKIDLLEFFQHESDKGYLVPLESNNNIPFEIKRVYFIHGTSDNTKRGFHAHKHLQQVAICVSGSCVFLLDDGNKKTRVKLDKPNKGLYIGNNVWREMSDFSDDCVLLVLASEQYAESDYIRDYKEFLGCKK